MERESNDNNNVDSEEYKSFNIFFISTLVLVMCFCIFVLFMESSSLVKKDTEWQLVANEETQVKDVRFKQTWNTGSRITMDTEQGSVVLDITKIDYFVSTDKPSYFEVRVFKENHHYANWVPELIKKSERKRAMLTLYINENDTNEVSKRFADNLGRTLIFIKGEDFTGELKDSYTSLPDDFDANADVVY